MKCTNNTLGAISAICFCNSTLPAFASTAGPLRKLTAPKPSRPLAPVPRAQCAHFSRDINTHNSDGWKVKWTRYNTPSKCSAACKAGQAGMTADGVYSVKCNLWTCGCTLTSTISTAKYEVLVSNEGTFYEQWEQPKGCAMPVALYGCGSAYQWCRDC